ncbi:MULTISPECIES: hypothetical protein [unclassified Okeania]|uniref:hypothetical protein n=2 Tax=Okeania TaxID=1458928 RepID=UPI0013BAC266|nr:MULTISPECIES: hypothetical protein [unclassified Okeania]NES76918.1 hypothetical protein [Okeania sp. SIO1H4]NET14013.1 hypothetical protein [Okeania sp. SIO1H6]NET20547.1 hypothetical protein [Okeania sp. SIO1H5]NET93714.1 hypothetical protein [Okeania sp. SIO1H2]
MLRDIKDVALSDDARARNKHDMGWSRNRNYKSAVSDWNQSLLNTWNYLESNKRNNLFVCEYKKLFSGNDNYFYFLLNFLEIEENKNMYIYYKSITKDWDRFKQREKIIDKDKLAYIEENSNYFLRDKILQITAHLIE